MCARCVVRSRASRACRALVLLRCCAQWPVVARRRCEHGRWRMLTRMPPCPSLMPLTRPCLTVSCTARRERLRPCPRLSRRNLAAAPGWPDGGVGPARKAPSNSGRPGAEGPVWISGGGEVCGQDAESGVAESGRVGRMGSGGCAGVGEGAGSLTEWLDRPSHTTIGYIHDGA